MRKILPVGLVLLVVAACVLGCGQTDDSEEADSPPDSAGALTEEQRRELERVATLGYVAEGDLAPESADLTVREDDAFAGYTAYTSRDHAGAFLVDMDGSVVHSWHESEPKNWVRVHVYPDGSALGISTRPGRLVKLDRDSRELWTYGGFLFKAHHDVRVESDSRIYALMRGAREIPWFKYEGGMNEDLVVVLESDGTSVEEVQRVSLMEAFRSSEFSWMLDEPWFAGSDPLHANSLEVLDGRVPHPAFSAGNILLSLRSIDALAVLDPERGEIVWVNRGRWQAQHEARVTPEGRILLFDNRKEDGQSRVVEYDVVTDEIVWSYTADGFFTSGAGAQQLLPNGDVLVTESQQGRVFEVTRDGRIVWDYTNPRRFKGGRTVVRVPRAVRFPTGHFDGSFRERLQAG